MQTLGPLDVVALTIWGEARGEPVEGKIAVACVLRNRLSDGRWGATYERVCLARKQFSCWNPGDPNQVRLQTFRTQIQQGTQPSDMVLRECYWIAEGLIRNVIRPRVGQATHYHAITITPRWAKTGKVVEDIGRHRFYEDVP